MEKKSGMIVCIILSVAMGSLLLAGNSQAQTYPRGPVQIVIPFVPGGSTDILWRGISDFLAKNVNGTLSLVNKPGGGGIVGTSYVINAKPDGYTLVSANSDPLNIAPLFAPEAPYNPDKDLTYIAKLGVFAFTVIVRAESPFKTLEELVAFARANPGKLKAGVAGVGTTPHMIIEMLKKDAKIDLTPVPFGGGGEGLTNLLGGHIDLIVLSITPVKALYLAGKVRILALFSPKRRPDFPEIPTVAEKGYRASNITTGIGLAGPKGLPSAIVKTWAEAVEKTMKDPKVVKLVDNLEGIVIDYKRGEEYKKEILADLDAFKPIVATLSGGKK